MSRTLFVSDVHLRPNDAENNRPFFRFLEQDCASLYVVGDLFDYWIGPKHLTGPDYRGVFEALRRKSERTKIFFIKGNRDYLVEGKFERVTGMTVLGDRGRIVLGGRTVLLAHGDFVYNTNPKYAAYRTLMRSKPIEDLWLAVPGGVARRLVRGYRKVSPLTTPRATWTPEKVLARARPFFAAGADVLICGHLHQPQHLTEDVKGRRCELFMMGDWCGGTQDYVEHDGAGFHFRRWER